MNRRLINTALVLALCAPLAGVSQDNPLSAPRGSRKANTGTVVFFRQKRFLGGGIAYKVREGEVELGKLSNGSFFSLKARAGKHEYVVHSEARDVLTLEVEAGETYFVSFSLSMGVVAGRPNLSPSDRQTFAKLQSDLKDMTGKGIDR